jgi:hypothetical protein
VLECNGNNLTVNVTLLSSKEILLELLLRFGGGGGTSVLIAILTMFPERSMVAEWVQATSAADCCPDACKQHCK